MDDDLRGEIEQLEERIEQLAATIEGCRKIILASRVAIVLGALLLLAMTLGTISSDPTALAGAFAAILGGIVFLGSNSSTRQEAMEQLREAEEERAELIGRIDLQIVKDTISTVPEIRGR